MSDNCAGCGRSIKMKGITGIRWQMKLYHKKCFVCSVCELHLSAGSCFTRDGQLFCSTHFYLMPPVAAVPVAETAPISPRDQSMNITECWYHGQMEREEAETLIKNDGDFLVRTSSGKPGEYIVTVMCKMKPIHFVCPRTPTGWNFNGKSVPTIKAWIRRAIESRESVCTKLGAKVILVQPVEALEYYDTIDVSSLAVSSPAGPAATVTAATTLTAAVAAAAAAGVVAVPTVAAVDNKSPDKAKRKSSLLEKHKSIVDDVQITMDKGNICDQKVDVIVNSVGAHLDLTKGALSASLLAAAGDDMQKELQNVAPKFYAQPGEVFVTKGYKLHCKHVIHAICFRFTDKGQPIQGYRHLIQRILAEADQLKACSIAIPPIGTGNLGYPPNVVSTIITEELVNFLDTHPKSTLKNFHIIVLTFDDKLGQAFGKLLLTGECDNGNQMKPDDVEELRDVIKRQSETNTKAQPEINKLGTLVPQHWSMVESGQPYNKCEVKSGSKEFATVIQNMTDLGGDRHVPFVDKIERIENLRQYQMFEVSKRVMAEKNKPRTDVERILWHGTDSNVLDSICQHGFNRAYCGKNGVLYGKGVYSAVHFSYSARDIYSPPDSHGRKVVIQCRVLTGDYTLGTKNMIAPPERSPAVLYDTAVDDINNPTLFVVFYDFVMYPEYVITFFA